MKETTPRRILVPINGGETDHDVIRLACRMARRGKAAVYVITILEVRRSLALDSVQEAELDRAEGLLTAAEKLAGTLEVALETELLQAREAGPAIVDEVREWRADLVVMGLAFRQRFGEFHMGKTVPLVLKFAPCRVVVVREEPGS